MKDQMRIKQICIICFAAVLAMLAIHIAVQVRFNTHQYRVHGNDEEQQTYMAIDTRQNSTSSWLKRGWRLDSGSVVDLNGTTIDGTLYKLLLGQVIAGNEGVGIDVALVHGIHIYQHDAGNDERCDHLLEFALDV